MRAWLLMSLGLLLVLAGCVLTPSLGARPALPTAEVGVASTGNSLGTPIPRRVREGVAEGPTSTPAPWATPLPPTPPSPPYPVEHSLEGMSDCRKCHWRGIAGGMPEDHYRRQNETCLGCHQVAGGHKPTPARTPSAQSAPSTDD